MGRLGTFFSRLIAAPTARNFITPGLDAMGQQMLWGEPVKYESQDAEQYLQTSNAVYVCARYRAQLLTSIPLKLYKVAKGGKKIEVTSGPLNELFALVNPFWTLNRLLEMTELSLCIWGESFWFYEKGKVSGFPQQIWWAKPDLVKVIPSATGYISHFEYRPTIYGDPIIYEPNETLWLRFPNPVDEFQGLSPLASAALAADTGRSAQISNLMMFRNGLNPGGFISPTDPNVMLTKEQIAEIESQIDQRFRGADKAHRWGVFKGGIQFTPNSLSPKDAEYLGGLAWSFEEVARAYGVPVDLIGGKSTFNNVHDARVAIWTETMLPEARFIATELTEQLLPLFPGEADLAEFDTTEVSVLQEDEDARWTRTMTAFLGGTMRLNEVREIFNLDPIKGVMGDALILPRGAAYIDDTGEVIATAAGVGDLSALTGQPFASDQPTDANPQPGVAVDVPPAAKPKALPKGQQPASGKQATQEQPPANETPPPRLMLPSGRRAMPYGSDEHQRILQRAADRRAPHEQAFGDLTASLMRRQRQSVLAKLNGARSKSRDAVKDLADNPFDKPAWTKQFRVAARPALTSIVTDAGQQVRDDLGISASFDVKDPNVIRFLEQRAQRFAQEVNDTTWEALKGSLSDGIDDGESIDDLADRVRDVMGGRIASSGETIARTEVLGASSGGSLLSAQQSGVVGGKEWIASLDNRVRPDHADAHGQTVALDDDFQVGDASGPAPGMTGDPAEDINCFPGDTVVYYEDVLAATRREYRGEVVRLRVDDGRVLTATPNHPILTSRGWVEANALKLSDDLIGYRLAQDVAISDPDPYDEPATFDEVFRFAEIFGAAHRMAGSPKHFHGDGMQGEVQVVRPLGELRREIEAAIQEPTAKQVLAFPDVLAGDLMGDGPQLALTQRTALSASGDMRRVGETFALGFVGVGHAGEHRLGSVARLNTGAQQATADNAAVNAEVSGQRLFRHPGEITLSKIVNIERDSFAGHVYNLQTETGYYLSNGIITHNCRCVLSYVLDVDWNPDGSESDA